MLMRAALYALLLTPAAASAVNLELSVGMNEYKLTNDGTWYQEAFPHDLDLKSEAWAVGISHKFSNLPLLRAEYVSLGMSRVNSWDVPNDYNYDPNTNQCVGECMPLANYVSKGSVKGLALSVAPEWNLGPVAIYAEGGIYVYQPTYKAAVENVYCCFGDAVLHFYPETVTVKHTSHTSFTYLFGIGARYKNLDFSVRYYDVEAADDAVPAVYIGATTAMLRVTF